MQKRNQRTSRVSPAVVLAACVTSVFVGRTALAAPSIYFDVNGTVAGSGLVSGNTYSWEDANWTTVSAGTATPVNWVEGDFARFAAGSDVTSVVGNYTVTANANHHFGGMFLQVGAANSSVTINGTGTLTIDEDNTTTPPTPIQGVLVRGSTSLIINNTIDGTGGLSFQSSGGTGVGSLYLYGNNSYSGGTLLSTGGGLNFNNNNSFGTGAISWNTASPVLADPDATGPLTIANAMNTRAATAGNLTIASPTVAPVTFSGLWTLGTAANTLTIGNNALPSTVTTISGNITGGGPLIKAGAGTLILSGTANNYTGTTTVSAGILRLATASAIPTTTSLILSGGTLDPDALTQNLSAATLGLTASSTIDFSAGTAEVDFANSSALTWSGTLNLTGFDLGIDKLRFGADTTGLTPNQLASITINGATPSAPLILDANGFLAVPEPSSLLFLTAAPALLLTRRRTIR